jgi:hypothetical protein
MGGRAKLTGNLALPINIKTIIKILSVKIFSTDFVIVLIFGVLK